MGATPFEGAIARVSLGLVLREELPGIALQALEAGHDSPSLRLLAGLSEAEMDDAFPLFHKALSELALSLPPMALAIRLVAGDPASAMSGNDGRDNDHKKHMAGPDDIKLAHAHSSHHLREVLASTLCGCFHCCARFHPSEVTEWVDEDEAGVGQTALCPRCGIDSVIGDRSGFPVSKDFLGSMNAHWF